MSEAPPSRREGSQASQDSQAGQYESDSDEDIEENDGVILSNAQKVYLESNNCKKQLYLMCVGLMDGGSSIFDVDAEPWKTVKKRDIKPTRAEFVEEVRRRGNLFSIADLKPANWRASRCVEWLQANPLVNEQDILFLKNEVQRFKEIVLTAQQERGEEEARQTGQWRGPIPYKLFEGLILHSV